MHFTRRTFTAGVAASAGLLATHSSLAQSTPGATPVANDIEARILALMDEFGVPGAVIGAVFPDSPEPVFMELGVANIEANTPISADMNFRIASVTKTYVATVVLQLVDEDSISLDDTIGSILPDLDVANADVVTVRNLLSMRSGLPQLTDSPEYVDTYLTNFEANVSFSDYAPMMAGIPAHSEPDTAFEYNNFNFNILGEMIEVVTGESWHANVQSRISDQLGLSNTRMLTVPEMPEPYANGYGHVNQALPEEMVPEGLAAATPAADVSTPVGSPIASPETDGAPLDLTLFNPTIAGAAGGLISTVSDQLIWAQALSSGEFISADLHAEQIDSYPTDESGAVGYGLGILDIGQMYGHNGAINGYQSVVISSPEFGIHIAVLTNAHPTIGFADAATTIASELLM